MSKSTNQTYLRGEQYKDSANLNARIRLHDLFSANKHGSYGWLFDHFKLPRDARILELGCGPATLWVKNLDRVPDGWCTTLTDFSLGMLEDARRNLGENANRFNFEVVDAQSIPFEDQSFDAVIANYMLYHIPDRPKAFSEIQRVLKPGGRFYAAASGARHMVELDELLARFNPQLVPLASGIVQGFTLENGREQIEPWLSYVKLYRFEDSLVVTEAEPLVNHVLSSIGKREALGDRLGEFTHFVEGEIASKGSIRIGKEEGLFEAIKPS